MSNYRLRNSNGILVIPPEGEFFIQRIRAARGNPNAACKFDPELYNVAQRILSGDTDEYNRYLERSGCAVVA